MTALAFALAPAIETLDEVVIGNVFLWPLLALAPLVALAFAWGARARRRALAQLGNPSSIGRLAATVNHGNRILQAAALAAAVACVGFAAMRPQYGGTAKIVPASGLDLVLVVDYSKSMLAKDVYPTRNERLEAELGRFLDDADRRGDRVGVVVFAGQARGFPVTRDARMLKLYLEKADPRTENPGGTAIGRGLKLALTFLIDARRGLDDAFVEEPEDEPPPPPGAELPAEVPPAENDQAIVLLTDGEDTESRPIEVGREAAKLGVRVYTVGIGSKSGEPIQKFDENGEPDGFVTDDKGEYVMTRIDEDLLQELAETTGGRYIRVDPERFALEDVRSMLEELSRSQREDTVEIHREEGFPFFVLPALFLIAIAIALPERRAT